MKKLWAGVFAGLMLIVMVVPAQAVDSKCEECHKKVTPGIVKDFNRGIMAESLECSTCHGEGHQGMDDVEKVKLPTIKTCQMCHSKQAKQYLSGKHALGMVALKAMPNFHMQPMAFNAGQKGCGGCHTLGLKDDASRQTEERKYYKYGMDCQNCHTRHMFSKKEAQEPEACMTCHIGFDHAQWEMWSGSKHGVAYLLSREIDPKNKDRAPKCQTCHMQDGNHRVMTAWGFLGVRLPEADKEWMGYRATILKGLGVLDADGQPTGRLDVVKAGQLARLDKASFDTERKRITDVCMDCHSANFVNENMKNADQMLKAADKLFAEAIDTVSGLYKDGIIKSKDGRQYPDLLEFYDVYTHVEEILYEMFMDHRMKTFQASFHMFPDYATWYGYSKMQKDLVEIKELAVKMRKECARETKK